MFNDEKLDGIATYQARAGWYVDAIASGGLFDGRITTTQRGETTGLNGTSAGASLEAGYPIPLHWQKLEVEPQVQLVYQHLDFSSRTDVDGLSVAIGGQDEGIARVGARLKRQFQADGGTLVTPYLKVNFLQNIGNGGKERLGGIGFATGDYGTVFQVGGGATGTLTRNFAIYSDVAWQDDIGDGGLRGWSYNAGIRYTFGTAPQPIATPIVAPAPSAAAARTYLVFFDWDRAVLSGRARQIVAEAAANVPRASLTRRDVDGYTDPSGPRRYNQGLSVRRAEAVTAELVRDGVPRGSIAVRGFGDTGLLVATGPGVREPQNRRVEIVLH